MKRTPHNLSHNHKLTMKMGQLVPVLAQKMVMGDTILHSVAGLLRCLPLATPVMHRVDVEFITTFTPTRLYWPNVENFLTGGPDGMDNTAHPRIALNHTFAGPGTLSDYLGYKNSAATFNDEVDADFHRAYALNYNELFRDQDLVAPLPLSTADGLDTTTNTALVNAAWGRDNYTTARPWTQKGPDVLLPLGDRAPIVFDPAVLAAGGRPIIKDVPAGNPQVDKDLYSDNAAGLADGPGSSNPLTMDLDDTHYTDLSGATSVDVNRVRLAFALQRYEEARARYGSRFTEYLRYLGIKPSDARLQRPEVLSRSRNVISFTEVLNTASETGAMYGHGISGARGNRYMYFCEEPGILMTFCIVRPRTQYMQGTARQWFMQTKEDYYQRELEAIGQQEVLYRELRTDHADGGSWSTGWGRFGYQDRYYYLRRIESMVSGLFRTTLKDWHMAREFNPADNTVPELNDSFVTSNPTTRVFQDESGDNILLDISHNLRARRLVGDGRRSFIM